MNITTDIYDNLVTNNILGGTDLWTLFAGTFYEKDLHAAIITGGENKTPWNSSQLIRMPRFQILLSAADYDIGYMKAEEVYLYLLNAAIPNYINITPSAGTTHLGKNNNNLHLFSINFDALHIQ